MFAKKIKLLLLIFMVWALPSFAESLRISQLDSNRLLFDQQIKLFLSVTDDYGNPVENLQKPNFQILESADGRTFKKIPEIGGFQVGTNYEEGVNFLLLVDNSESMYWTMEGEKTQNVKLRRISQARKALKAFLKSITNPKDRVGIAAYNSYYTLLSEPVNDKTRIEQLLEDIKRPSGDGIYSEIYGSLYLAVEEFQTIKGRKALIVLSDGMNNPAYRYTKKINEQFGEKFVSYKKPLDELLFEGISLYVINFGKKGDKKDRYLTTIARNTGGVTFDAHNAKELENVYLTIIDQILKEYIVTYKANMDPTEKKYVRVQFSKNQKRSTATRYYFAGTVFGRPQKQINFLFFIALILAGFLLWSLSRLKFEKQSAKPSIEILSCGEGQVSTQVLTLGGDQTIIGSAQNADMTITGIPEIEENHATIIFNQNKNNYTIVSEGKLMVNNRIVSTKILEPGDLINFNGTTMIFDEGTENHK